MECTRDVSAAGKIGKILGQRLLFKDIPAVSIFMKREQKYHGKVKAVIDGLRDSGRPSTGCTDSLDCEPFAFNGGPISHGFKTK